MQETPKLSLLAAGALLGLAIAAFGLLDYNGQATGLPDNAIARVNDALIDQDGYADALERLRNDSRNPVDAEDRQWVLDRLIEEELLVQHGLALGMAHSEHNVRGAVVRALISSATAQAKASNPEESDLRQYYADNIGLFTTVSAVAIRAWTLPDAELAEELARNLNRQLTDSKELVIPAELSPVLGLPGGLLPIAKLRDYLGRTLTAHIQQQAEHTIAAYAGVSTSYIVQVLQKEAPQAAPYESIEMQVLIKYRQALADEALRKYIDELRDRATIEVRPL